MEEKKAYDFFRSLFLNWPGLCNSNYESLLAKELLSYPLFIFLFLQNFHRIKMKLKKLKILRKQSAALS